MKGCLAKMILIVLLVLVPACLILDWAGRETGHSMSPREVVIEGPAIWEWSFVSSEGETYIHKCGFAPVYSGQSYIYYRDAPFKLIRTNIRKFVGASDELLNQELQRSISQNCSQPILGVPQWQPLTGLDLKSQPEEVDFWRWLGMSTLALLGISSEWYAEMWRTNPRLAGSGTIFVSVLVILLVGAAYVFVKGFGIGRRIKGSMTVPGYGPAKFKIESSLGSGFGTPFIKFGLPPFGVPDDIATNKAVWRGALVILALGFILCCAALFFAGSF